MSVWIVILGTLVAINLVIHPSHGGYEWFLRLRRPSWFDVEGKVPLIWVGFDLCFFLSAWLVLEPSWSRSWALSYLALGLLAHGVDWLVCTTRSLLAGVVLAALAWIWALITLLAVTPVSPLAAALLVPYGIWGPVAIVGRLQMHQLNPGARRSR